MKLFARLSTPTISLHHTLVPYQRLTHLLNLMGDLQEEKRCIQRMKLLSLYPLPTLLDSEIPDLITLSENA
jgi:hypothetical protein